ncbi:hypothetical protein PG993_011936 [Apiospora rasikravindrae]|uniref:Ankyrin repeat domain-containing protein n=1 Tax=Apiospora rasikravindrae TaxID=990691 RepID=A0ABR1S2G9_9PEZI
MPSCPVDHAASCVSDELTCSEQDLSIDLFVAAIWFGKKDYIRQRVNESPDLFDDDDLTYIRSGVFGIGLWAAAIRGDVEMCRLLLPASPEARRRTAIWGNLVLIAAAFEQYEVFELAFEYHQNLVLDEADAHRTFEAADKFIRWPAAFERIRNLAAVEVDDAGLSRWLADSILHQHVERLRHHLRQGARLEPVYFASAYECTAPLMLALQTGNEAIVRILLDEAGANPRSPEWRTARLSWPPLALAVWKGSANLVRLLLNRGADPDAGAPPPLVVAVFEERPDLFRLLRDRGARLDPPWAGAWAMAVARMHGLESMVDMLIAEGVSADEVYHHAGERNEQTWWYRRL